MADSISVLTDSDTILPIPIGISSFFKP